MIVDLISLIGRSMLLASAAIVVVLLSRQAVRCIFGAAVAYGLWLLVPIAAVAVCLPSRTVVVAVPPSIATASSAASVRAPALGGESSVVDSITSDGPGFDALGFVLVLLGLWLVGVAVQLARLVIGHRRMIATMMPKRDGEVFRVGRSDIGPAVIGVLRPRIVVPADFEQRYSAQERSLVLAHERAHIDAGDLYVNAAAALAVCVNWFNPLFYAARRALRIDQELACDERVMRRFAHARKAYGRLLLKAQLAAVEPSFACQWPARGEVGLKRRLAMLAVPPPGGPARRLGYAVCAGLVAAGGATAWASQPPTTRYVEGPLKNSAAAVRTSMRAQVMGRALVEAITEDDDARAHWLIGEGADVDHVLPGDGTPLIVAVRRRNAAMVSRLLEAGADVNRPAKGDGSALIVAAQVGDLKLTRTLVNAGADVNGFVRGDETPLINAAGRNRVGIARFLIARGADVNLEVDAPTTFGLIRRSPISVARKNGHARMLRLLREHGASD